MAPTIRGNSLYTVASGTTWDSSRSSAISSGGDLTAINSGSENIFVFRNFGIGENGLTISSGYWIGLTDQLVEGDWRWSNGDGFLWHPNHWFKGEPNGNGDWACVKAGFNYPNMTYDQYVALIDNAWRLDENGVGYIDNGGPDWDDTGESMNYGVAEIALTLTTTLPTTIKEGAGEFTVNIDLSAGTTSQKHSLIQGARVWYVVSGIDSSDLETGYALQGSGVIDENGNIVVDGATSAGIKLALKNDGAAETDTLGIKFYSADPATTTEVLADVQIGTEATQAVVESAPVIRGKSLYQIIQTPVNGSTPFFSTPNASSVAYNWFWDNVAYARAFGGDLATISTLAEQDFLNIAFGQETDWGFLVGLHHSDADNQYRWVSGEAVDLQMFNIAFDSAGSHAEDYTRVYLGDMHNLAWGDCGAESGDLPTLGIIEIPLALTTSLPTTINEGAGEFTVNIDLSAGTTSQKHSLIQGARVWYVVSGIDSSDLETGYALQGTGVIDENGNIVIDGATSAGIKLALKNDGVAEADTLGIKFYSADPTTTTEALADVQIGVTSTKTVSESNSAPNDILLTPVLLKGDSPAIREDSAAGTLVGALSASDPDVGTTFTYSLVQGYNNVGVNNSLFEIIGNELRLKSGVTLDYETGSLKRINIRVTDSGDPSLSYSEEFYIYLINTNEKPTDISVSSSGIAENSAGGALLGTLISTDPDSGPPYQYSQAAYALVSGDGDTSNSLVEIVGDKIYLKADSEIDYEETQALNIRVQVSDSGDPALTFAKGLSINVLNVQEGGSLDAITSSTPGTFKEGVTLTAGSLTDPDGITGSVTYKWYKGATEVQSGASTTYEVGPRGEGTYRVDAVYVDGTGSTVTTSSATQVVDKADNGQGTLSSITSSVPGTFQEGVRLTAGSITGDLDGNGTITGYQWYFNDAAITTNGTSSFYDVSNTGYGNYKVAVTYSDGQLYSSTLTTTNQVVSKIDNGNGAVSITGTAAVGSTLTSTINTPDPDGNGTFSYQWQSSSNGSTWSNITGATTGTYLLTSNELTKQVRVVVSSTDAQGYGPIALNSNSTVPVVNPPDNSPPTIAEISVQGNNVVLNFSEKIQATGINNSTFVVKVGGTARTVSATNYDSTNQNKVTLTLSGTAPASSTSLQITYSATGSNIVKDLAGNSLGTFTNRSADTFLSGASVTSLYADYTNLTLTGSTAINGTGNAKNNTIIGNQANNTLNGAAGADVLTGAGGTDTFVYTTLTNSLLGSPTNYTFDRITDFAIGQDRIDGPKTASASQVLELGAVATLDQAGLQAVLTAPKFVANGAASFTYNDNGTLRTFVALNNNVAGFDVTKDAVAEITGYSGLLTSLAIV